MGDYLQAEQPIIAQLKAKVTGARAVLSAADLAGVTERAQITPALHVLYDGDIVDTGPGARGNLGAAQRVEQQWMVIVAVRNARDPLGGSFQREQAGPLISDVLTALQGWAPAAIFRPMRRIAPRMRPTYSSGFAYFPLSFSAQMMEVP